MLTEYGKFLKKLRIDVGETRAQMAKRLGVSSVYLSFIENGTRDIPLALTANIWETYHLTPEQTKELLAAERANPIHRYTIDLNDFLDSLPHIQATQVFATMLPKLSTQQAQEVNLLLQEYAVKNDIPHIVWNFSS